MAFDPDSQIRETIVHFFDTFSRVDQAPESVLYDAAGAKVMDLEKADVTSLLEAGFKYPESFGVKADDGTKIDSLSVHGP